MGIAPFILVLLNCLISYKGFKDYAFFDKFKFEIDAVLIRKEYYRIISAAFLHIDWQHLIFNMISLLVFSGSLTMYLGDIQYLTIYFLSIIGGKTLAIFIHPNHGDYCAVGASGAVYGLIFAAIALFPGMTIFGIPGALVGVGYVIYSIYGIKSAKDNIGHEAHLGGGIAGLITAIFLKPEAIISNYISILLILIPSVIFLYIIITRPYVLYIDNVFFKKKQENYFDIDHKYQDLKQIKQVEVDRILDKISKKGIDSISQKERNMLDKYSQNQKS